jgi:ABC-type transport system involved in multi-copper enzyme maturation permease subunit
MTTGKPFLEVLSSALNEDYRFPTLEIFAFLYTIGTFVFANLAGIGTQYLSSGESIAFSLVNSLTGLPSLILVVLILKNIAFGLGNELEKGIVQTYLSYPLKRRSLLTAKLLSSLGLAVLLFTGIQVFALYILVPDIIAPYFGIVLLSFISILGYPLFIAGVALIITLKLKRGSTAFIVGLLLYFGSGIIPNILPFTAETTIISFIVRGYALINPSVPLFYHFLTGAELWNPSFTEALFYIGASYALIITLFIIGYFYFTRRLEM